MSEWQACTLSDVLKFGNGKSRPKESGEIPVYGGNGILDYTNCSNYSDETIVIGRVGAYCGATYYEDQEIWVSDNALSAKALYGNDTKFLYYFLKNLDLNQFAQGSSHPLLTQTLLNSIEVGIPSSLAEQKAIASVLSSLDDKIDLLHRQNKTLEAMAETLFRQWFIEEAKEDWELETLGNHIQSVNGVSYKSSELNPSNIALVTLKNFERNGGLRTDGFKEFTGTFKDSQIMEDGDIAVAHTDLTQDASLIGNPIYILNLSNYDKLVISMDLVKVNLDSNTITKCFLFHLLKSTDFKDYALACSNGSSVIHLSKKALPSFKFKCPPTEKIGRFTNLVDPMDQKIQKNIKQIQTLENLRDTLLPKLMSGEVRVQYQTEEVA
ncbi:restriction endonuclease subunit S [Acinetobacter sp. YH12075]|uniref:restriction endonuclease subunit S n=1 Tax=Acinetobacter sp. YH12075 TaxID=2601070 RepID=UPI0015D208BC|nr:restriction endonuclease subunit S [Acinetobacter sp. YH12075]